MGPSISEGGRLPDRSAIPPPESGGGQPFTLSVEQDDTTLYLRITGEFDLACIGRVEAALGRVSATQTTRVVFDLQRVDFIDLAGLSTILRANDNARSAPFEVVVVRPRGLANRVFTLTRADDQLELVDHISTNWSDGPFRQWSA